MFSTLPSENNNFCYTVVLLCNKERIQLDLYYLLFLRIHLTGSKKIYITGDILLEHNKLEKRAVIFVNIGESADIYVDIRWRP